MSHMRYCVAQGNPFDGVTLYGPFDTAEDADEWAITNDGGCDWWIIDLNSPQEDSEEDDEDSIEAEERRRMTRKFSPPQN